MGRALFHAEDEKEAHQNERGEHEEKTEADEQPAKIAGGLAGDRFSAHIAKHEADLRGIEFFLKRGFDLRAFSFGESVTHRGGFAVAVGPKFLAGGQRDKGFGSAAMLFPIFLVLVADAAGIKIDAGIPVAQIVFVHDAGKVGHQLAPTWLFRGHDTGYGEGVLALFQLPVEAEHIIIYFNFVTDLCPEVILEPLGDKHLIAGGCVFKKSLAHAGNHRVRHGIRADAKFVGNVRERRLGIGSGLQRVGIEKNTVGAKVDDVVFSIFN